MGEIGPAARRIVRRVNADRDIEGRRLYFDIAGYLVATVAAQQALGLPVEHYALMRVTGQPTTLRSVQDELSALALADQVVPAGRGRSRCTDVVWVRDLILRDWASDEHCGRRPRRCLDVTAAAALVREHVALDQAAARADADVDDHLAWA